MKIGQRGFYVKRPAVLCAVAFMAGIFAGKILLAAAGAVLLWMAGGIVALRRKKEKRRISVAERTLVFVPLFLLLGAFGMSRKQECYEENRTRLLQVLQSGKEVLAKGTVAQMTMTDKGVRFELEKALVKEYQKDEACYCKVGTLLVYAEEEELNRAGIKDGQQVFLYGKAGVVNPAGNKGSFDAKQYYFSLGITGTVSATAIRVTDAAYHRLDQAFFQIKKELQEHYTTYMGSSAAGVVSSMLLGDRSYLSEETETLYRQGGISHILAISGLHVSLLGMAVYRLLQKSVFGKKGAIPVTCGIVVLYGRFVGAGVSTKRAVIMFLLLLFSEVLGKTYDTLSAMSVSAVLLLWNSPGAIYTAAFQLSYAAACGASVLPVLFREKEGVEVPKKSSALFFGAAMQLVTFPFTVVHFFEYPLYGFLVNPVVLPFMTILLLCAFFCGCFGMLWSAPGYFFAGAVRVILWLYEFVCKLAGKLPFSLLLFGQPTWGQVGVYFLLLVCSLLFLQWREKQAKWRKRGGTWLLALLLAGLPLCLLPLPAAPLETAFLDVGQGDAVVLREQEGTVITIDGGSSSVQNVGKKRIAPYLKAKGIRVIDCAFLSHADNDHVSGIKELLAAMPVLSAYRLSAAGYRGNILIKRLVLPKLEEPDASYLELAELAREKNVEVYYMEAGETICFGEKLSFACLSPEKTVAYEDKNAASLVLLATYGSFDVLLTGDIDTKSEAGLVERQVLKDAEIEVLKVAHHGSATSSSEAFLTMVKPAFSIISCGEGNRYGHPHDKTLEALRKSGTKELRTDRLGCITIKVWRDGYRIYGGAGENGIETGY